MNRYEYLSQCAKVPCISDMKNVLRGALEEVLECKAPELPESLALADATISAIKALNKAKTRIYELQHILG